MRRTGSTQQEDWDCDVLYCHVITRGFVASDTLGLFCGAPFTLHGATGMRVKQHCLQWRVCSLWDSDFGCESLVYTSRAHSKLHPNTVQGSFQERRGFYFA